MIIIFFLDMYCSSFVSCPKYVESGVRVNLQYMKKYKEKNNKKMNTISITIKFYEMSHFNSPFCFSVIVDLQLQWL